MPAYHFLQPFTGTSFHLPVSQGEKVFICSFRAPMLFNDMGVRSFIDSRLRHAKQRSGSSLSVSIDSSRMHNGELKQLCQFPQSSHASTACLQLQFVTKLNTSRWCHPTHIYAMQRGYRLHHARRIRCHCFSLAKYAIGFPIAPSNIKQSNKEKELVRSVGNPGHRESSTGSFPSEWRIPRDEHVRKRLGADTQ